jgi:hypothetical protein
LGGPGIGYKQDFFASQRLKQESPATFERYVSSDKNAFLFFPPISGLDGAKVGVLSDDGKELARAEAIISKAGENDKQAKEVKKLAAWWSTAKADEAQDKPLVMDAKIYGGRMALRMTSYVPLTMAIMYFLLVIYFRMTGGYKQVEIHHQAEGAMSEL